jgi:hypothetical protein
MKSFKVSYQFFKLIKKWETSAFTVGEAERNIVEKLGIRKENIIRTIQVK